MPTYDYLCTGCGQTFEVFQRMSDEPLSNCLDCGAPARRKISGGAGFIFKGDGFYITDHRSQEYKDKAAAEAGTQKPADAPRASDSGGAPAKSGKKPEKTAATVPDAPRSASGGGSDR